MEKQECQICASNQPENGLITCRFCSEVACKTCIKRYLLTHDHGAKCMFCKEPWSLEELHRQLGKVWMRSNTGFRKARVAAIAAREKAKIPETLTVALPIIREHLAEKGRRLPPPNPEKKQLEAKVARAELRLRRAQLKLNIFRERDETEKEKLLALLEEVKKEKVEPILNIPLVDIQYILFSHTESEAEEQPTETLLRACPLPECRGLVYKQGEVALCKACDQTVCVKCLSEAGDDHECSEEDLANAILLLRDSKPCPKCGVQITKASGCDQMWCTSCKTPFSWETGEILHRAVIHNPHALDFRRTGECVDGQGFFDPQEVARLLTVAVKELKGQDLRPENQKHPSTKPAMLAFKVPLLPPDSEDDDVFLKGFADSLVDLLDTVESILRRENTELRMQEAKLDALRVFYCMYYITEEKWTDDVFTADQTRARCVLVTNLLQTLRDGLSSEFTYITVTPDKAKDSLTRLVQLIHFVNEQSLYLSEVLGVVPRPLVSHKFEIFKSALRGFDHYKQGNTSFGRINFAGLAQDIAAAFPQDAHGGADGSIAQFMGQLAPQLEMFMQHTQRHVEDMVQRTMPALNAIVHRPDDTQEETNVKEETDTDVGEREEANAKKPTDTDAKAPTKRRERY